MTIWEFTARQCAELYGSFIDWDERFYVCPECFNRIYEDQYDRNCDYSMGKGGPCCPNCGAIVQKGNE